MNSVFRIIIITSLLLFTTTGVVVGENDGDRWLAKDKFMHFGYSAFLTGGSAVALNRHFDYRHDDAIIVGFGITITLGAAKEAIDYNQPGQTSSYKDLIWDVAGALTGAFIASFAL
ncbi:MAG: hypothetical protein V3W18_13300 [candidate division Zixibacteria bacterium]